MAELKSGASAPAFSLLDQDGKTVPFAKEALGAGKILLHQDSINGLNKLLGCERFGQGSLCTK